MGRPAATATAMIQCSFGLAPSTLVATSAPNVLVEGKPAATVVDSAPLVNIPPFGMCTSLGNPTVAAATAAASGVLTPMPCIPVTTPWINGAVRTLVSGKPALTLGAQCHCAYGGLIAILNPGAVRTLAG